LEEGKKQRFNFFQRLKTAVLGNCLKPEHCMAGKKRRKVGKRERKSAEKRLLRKLLL